MSDERRTYSLRVTGPAERQLARLPAGPAAAIVEFLTGPLVENPKRVGGPLQRELAGLYAARRGVYRIVYEILAESSVVVVHRVDHRSAVYRTR